jgi:hypothetical protein
MNSAVHSDITKNKYHIHRVTANLSCLPCGFTSLNNEMQYEIRVHFILHIINVVEHSNTACAVLTSFVLYMLYFYD